MAVWQWASHFSKMWIEGSCSLTRLQPKGFSLSLFKGRQSSPAEPDSPGTLQLDSPALISSQLPQLSLPTSAFRTQLSKPSFQTQLSRLSFPNLAFQTQLSNLSFQTQLPISASKLSFQIQLSNLSLQFQLSRAAFQTQLPSFAPTNILVRVTLGSFFFVARSLFCN